MAVAADNAPPMVDQGIPNQVGVVAGTGTQWSFQLPAAAFSDDDGDPLSYSTGTLPTWLRFNAVTRVFSGTPAADDFSATPISIQVSVTDGSAAASAEFSIAFAPPELTALTASRAGDAVAFSASWQGGSRVGAAVTMTLAGGSPDLLLDPQDPSQAWAGDTITVSFPPPDANDRMAFSLARNPKVIGRDDMLRWSFPAATAAYVADTDTVAVTVLRDIRPAFAVTAAVPADTPDVVQVTVVRIGNHSGAAEVPVSLSDTANVLGEGVTIDRTASVAIGAAELLMTFNVTPGAGTGAVTATIASSAAFNVGRPRWAVTDAGTVSATAYVGYDNRAPEPEDDSATVGEDESQVSFNVLANDRDDRPVANLRVSRYAVGTALGSSPVSPGTVVVGRYGRLTIDSLGMARYVPTDVQHIARRQGVVDEFTYQADDGSGLPNGTASGYIEIIIVGANDPPVTTPDSIEVTEDGPPRERNLLANDSDVDDGRAGLAVTRFAAGRDIDSAPVAAGSAMAAAGRYGKLTVTEAGVAEYTPAAAADAAIQLLNEGQRVEDEFRYEISDGTALIVGTLTVHVVGANDRPTLVAAANPDVTVTRAIAGSPISDPAAGGSFTYEDVDAADTGFGAGGDLEGRGAAAATWLTTVGSGVDGVPIGGSFGTVTLFANGSWTYLLDNANPTVAALAHGMTLADSFDFRIADHHVGADGIVRHSATETVTITVIGPNFVPAPPANGIPTVNATQGLAFAMDLSAHVTDGDGDVLTYAISSQPGWLSVTPEGLLSGTPPNGTAGRDFTASLTVTDGHGGRLATDITLAVNQVTITLAAGFNGDTNQLTVTVTNSEGVFHADSCAGMTADCDYRPGSFPVFVSLDALDGLKFSRPNSDLFASTSQDYYFSSTDILTTRGDTWQMDYSEATGPGRVRLRIRTQLTEPFAVVGTGVVRAVDSQRVDYSRTVATYINTPPIPADPGIGPQAAIAQHDYSLAAAAGFRDDTPRDILTYDMTGQPSWLTIDPATGMLSGQPPAGDIGLPPVTVTVSVTDLAGLTARASFELRVIEEPNIPPRTVIPVQDLPTSERTATEDAPFQLDIAGHYDDDNLNAELSFSYESVPDASHWLTLDGDGLLRGLPGDGDVGAYQVTVTVSDGRGGMVEDAFTLTVEENLAEPTYSLLRTEVTAAEIAVVLQLAAGKATTPQVRMVIAGGLPSLVLGADAMGAFMLPVPLPDALGEMRISVPRNDVLIGKAGKLTFRLEDGADYDIGAVAATMTPQLVDVKPAFGIAAQAAAEPDLFVEFQLRRLGSNSGAVDVGLQVDDPDGVIAAEEGGALTVSVASGQATTTVKLKRALAGAGGRVTVTMDAAAGYNTGPLQGAGINTGSESASIEVTARQAAEPPRIELTGGAATTTDLRFSISSSGGNPLPLDVAVLVSDPDGYLEPGEAGIRMIRFAPEEQSRRLVMARDRDGLNPNGGTVTATVQASEFGSYLIDPAKATIAVAVADAATTFAIDAFHDAVNDRLRITVGRASGASAAASINLDFSIDSGYGIAFAGRIPASQFSHHVSLVPGLDDAVIDLDISRANASGAGEFIARIAPASLADWQITGSRAVTVIVPEEAAANAPPEAVADSLRVAASAPQTIIGWSVLDNDRDRDAGDRLTVSAYAVGKVLGGAPAAVGQTVAGSFGTLRISAAGQVTYLVTFLSAREMIPADELTDTFTYQVSDGRGGTATARLAVTLYGTNDPPRLGEADGADKTVARPAGIDAGDLVAGGVFTYQDSDRDDLGFGNGGDLEGREADAETWLRGDNEANDDRGTELAGSYGHLYLRADGGWSYELDSRNREVFALRGAGTLIDSFDFRIDDGEHLAAANGRYSNVVTVDITIGGAEPITALRMAARHDAASQSVIVSLVLVELVGAPPRFTLRLDSGNGYWFHDGASPWLPGAAGPVDHEDGFRASAGAGDRVEIAYYLNPNGNSGDTITVELLRPAGENFDIIDSATLSVPVPATVHPPQRVAQVEWQAVSVTEGQWLRHAISRASFTDADGDRLNYEFTMTRADGKRAPGEWATIAPDPPRARYLLTGRPANEDVGDMTVAVTVADGKGGEARDSFTVTVVNVNDPPVVAAGLAGLTATAGRPFHAAIPANAFIDVDGDPLTYSSDEALGWLTFDGTAFTGMPGLGDITSAAAPPVIAVTARDGNGGEVTASFTLTVIAVANANPAVAGAGIPDHETAEDAPVTFTIASHFTDADAGDVLRYTYTAVPSAPWLTLAPTTGAFGGLPGNDDVAVYAVTVTATDRYGGAVADHFTLTVSNVNDAPRSLNTLPARPAAERTAREDAEYRLDVSGDFRDIDPGAVLTYSYVAARAGLPSDETAWLSFDGSSGRFSGVPLNEHVGEIDITVTATDGMAAISDRFTLSVVNENDPPVFSGPIGDRVVPWGSDVAQLALDLSGFFADVDAGDRLRFSYQALRGGRLSERDGWLSLDPVTGVFAGRPEAWHGGEVVILAVAEDGSGARAESQRFTLTVEPPPAPVARPYEGEVDEDVEALNGAVVTASADAGLAVTAYAAGSSLGDSPAAAGAAVTGQFGTLVISVHGTFAYWPAPAVQALAAGAEAVDVFTYMVADGYGGTDTATLTITVIGVNDAPELSLDAASVTSVALLNGEIQGNLSVSGSFSYQDADNDDRGFGSGGTIEGRSLAHSSWETGSDTANGNRGAQVRGLLGSLYLRADGSWSYELHTEDDSFDLLALGGEFIDGFEFRIDDGAGSAGADGRYSAIVPVNIRVRNIGQLPRLRFAVRHEPEAHQLVAAVTLVDPVDFPPSFTVRLRSGNGYRFDPVPEDLDPGHESPYDHHGIFAADAVVGTQIEMRYWLNPAGHRGDTIIAELLPARDGSFQAEGETVASFNIAPSANPPRLAAGMALADVSVPEDSAFHYAIPYGTFADADGDRLALSFTATRDDGRPAGEWLNFAFNGAARQFEFSGLPNGADAGVTTVTVVARDNKDGQAEDSFELTVMAVNDAPTLAVGLQDRVAAVGEPFRYSIPAEAFADEEGDPLSYRSIESLPWLEFDGIAFVGTPQASDLTAAPATVYVTAVDGNGGAVTASFQLRVTDAPNSKPLLLRDIPGLATPEDVAFELDIGGYFIETDVGDSLTFSYAATPRADWLTLSLDGTFTGTPANADVGVYTVAVVAADSRRGSAVDTFALMVSNVNDAPVEILPMDTQRAAVGVPFSLDLGSHIVDPDIADQARFAVTGNPPWLTFDGMRMLSGTAATADITALPAQLSVTASDDQGATLTVPFAMEVVAEFEPPPPVAVDDAVTVGEDAIATGNLRANDADFHDPNPARLIRYRASRQEGGLPTTPGHGTASGGVPGEMASGGTVPSETAPGETASGGTVPDGMAPSEMASGGTVPSEMAPGDMEPGGMASGEMAPGQIATGAYGTLVVAADGAFTYTPSDAAQALAADARVEDRFTYEISGAVIPAGARATATLTVTVLGSNDAPLAAAGIDPQRALVGRPFRLPLAEGVFSDAEGDALTVTARELGAADLPAWLNWAAVADGYLISGTPAAGDRRDDPHFIVVTARDSRGARGQLSFPLHVGIADEPPDDNEPPRVRQSIADLAVQAGVPVTLALPQNAFASPDGETLRYAVESLPEWLAFDEVDMSLRGTPPAGSAGEVHTLTLTATDPGGATAATSFRLAIGDPNIAPVARFAAVSVTAYVGVPFSLPVAENMFVDGDLDELRFELAAEAALPAWLSFDGTSLSGTPGVGDRTEDAVDIMIRARDGLAAVTTVGFRLTVAAAPDVTAMAWAADGQVVLAIPYIELRAAPIPSGRSCLSFSLRAPEADLVTWTLAPETIGSPACVLPPGGTRVAFLDDTSTLTLPAIQWTGPDGHIGCLQARLRMAEGGRRFTTLDMAMADCPAP